MNATRHTDAASLAAALLLCLCFGSIHAYGVLVAPLEQWLGISRTVASLGYSVAILAVTAGVFASGALGRTFTVAQRIAGACLLSAAGLAMLGLAPGVFTLIVGYGILFGLSNGLAYSLSLELSAEAMAGHPAKGIGLATATYGMGAVLSAQLLSVALTYISMKQVFLLLAGVIVAFGIMAAILSLRGGRAERQPATAAPAAAGHHALFLWSYYFLVALSGLMIIAHAPAIVTAVSHDRDTAALAAMLVSGGSVAGGYLGGSLAARWPGWPCLAGPALLQAIALVGIASFSAPALSLAALSLAGLCYGTIIAVIPAYIRLHYGSAAFPRIYGVVFTAWGAAGFLGPLVAGAFYDVSANYNLAILTAALLSAIGGAAGLFFGRFFTISRRMNG